MEEKQEEVKVEKKIFRLKEVPTEVGLAIETPEGEIISTEQLLVNIANELREVKVGIVG